MAKILKYLILALTVLNLPSSMLFFVSESLGSLFSYLTYALLLAYYIVEEKEKANVWLLAIGLTYFTISGINFSHGEERDFFIYFIKYVIMIVCGSTLVKKTSPQELFVFLFLGSISMILHATIFSDKYGRYSGLYINPNQAGFIAIVAYSLTFRIKKFFPRTLAQMLITIGGIFTFSRTFILIWLITNLLSIKISVKNVRILAAGFGLLVLLTIFGPMLKLNTERLGQFTAVINNEENALQKANEESRSETWSYYYQPILERPLFGNGYGSFLGGVYQTFGVHNSYLLILGEAGIIPFLLFSALYIYFIYMGIIMFKHEHCILMQAIALFLFLLTFHNFFTTDYVLILTLWVHHRIMEYKKHKLIVKTQ